MSTEAARVRRRRIGVNGVELDVVEAGEVGAPVVVLSHGFPESAHSWRHQIPVLAAAGYHVMAPDQRGYGRSEAPRDVAAYGIGALTGDLLGLVDQAGADQAVFVGHDWGALIVWDLARLHPERVRAVVGVSVPFVNWPMPPTALMKMIHGDRFFYILYFQPVGPAEAELERDVRHTMATVLWGASGPGWAARPAGDPPPMEGTGFLTAMAVAPELPFVGPEGPWLTGADLDAYTESFVASGFFGPVSYYRNLDANFAVVATHDPARLTMPSFFIAGTLDPVMVMDPGGVERMANLLPGYVGHVMIDGAGHWTQQEAPHAFNAALMGFLATLEDRP